MKLLVLGATGGVGRHIVSQAQQRGHDVIALVRPETAYDGPCLRGDPCDAAVVRSALDGVGCVVSSLGMRRKNVLNPFSAILGRTDLGAASARAIVDAMRGAGVGKLVAVSAAGVAESAPGMNVVMRGLVASSNIGVAYRDLAEMEKIFADSDLDWCAVRPVTLTDGAHTGRVRVVGHFGAFMTISRADVAHHVLDRVDVSGGPRLPQIAGGASQETRPG